MPTNRTRRTRRQTPVGLPRDIIDQIIHAQLLATRTDFLPEMEIRRLWKEHGRRLMETEDCSTALEFYGPPEAQHRIDVVNGTSPVPVEV